MTFSTTLCTALSRKAKDVWDTGSNTPLCLTGHTGWALLSVSMHESTLVTA